MSLTLDDLTGTMRLGMALAYAYHEWLQDHAPSAGIIGNGPIDYLRASAMIGMTDGDVRDALWWAIGEDWPIIHLGELPARLRERTTIAVSVFDPLDEIMGKIGEAWIRQHWNALGEEP